MSLSAQCHHRQAVRERRRTLQCGDEPLTRPSDDLLVFARHCHRSEQDLLERERVVDGLGSGDAERSASDGAV
jgi:hypothetical protein